MKSTQTYIHMMVSPNCSLWGTMGAYSTEICPCGRERVNYAVRKGVRDSYCQKSSHLVHQQQGQYLGRNSHRDSTISTVIVVKTGWCPQSHPKKPRTKLSSKTELFRVSVPASSKGNTQTLVHIIVLAKRVFRRSLGSSSTTAHTSEW